MNILIIGSGGREHALAWKVAQSPLADRIYVAPGNAGTALEAKVENLDIAVDDVEGLLGFAEANDIGLTIVGPELPLVIGVVDAFKAKNLRCFGPEQAPAQLEGSKSFSKDFLARHNIPTAAYQSFTELDAAITYIREQGAPIVIKADGLAAGKGVILADSEAEAIAAVEDILLHNQFGEAGSSVVIEAFLQGEEASFICMADGEHILSMASSQDHKAAHDGDQGPNTGGMGAYSPAPLVDDAMHARIIDEVVRPTIDGLKQEGMPYTGFLYAGIMVGDDGVPRVLEFNCRLGDPETQPIMMRMQSDLVAHCLAALDGTLDQEVAKWDKRAALGVVMAAEGYPNDYAKGDVIGGALDTDLSDTKVFFAGVGRDSDDQLVTAGGRVLCVTALGTDVKAAQQLAYETTKKIKWNGSWYRNDIGHRAINR